MSAGAIAKEVGTLRKILTLLSKRERHQLYWLFPAIILMAFMQVLGIASVMPFLTVVANSDVIENNAWLHSLYTRLNFTSANSFLFFLGVVVLGVLAFSNAFTVAMNWMLLRFVHMRSHTLSKRLLASYLHRPYAFFLDRNSADMSKSILSEVKEVVNGVLLPGMRMLARLTVVLFILILLIVADPILALSATLVLGGAYAAIFGSVRQKLASMGREKVKASRGRFKAVSEAIGGVKEIKLLGRESEFIRRFSKPSKRYASHQATKQIIAQLPRYGLETVAFGGILLVVLYLLAVRQDLEQVLPLLGLYAFAGYRLMPALQEVFGAASSLRFNLAALDVLYEDLHDQPKDLDFLDRRALAALPFRDSLALCQVTFGYDGAKGLVFEGLDLTIKANTSVAFVGATGSGKTTLVDLILGLLRPQEGWLVIDGVTLDDAKLPNWQKNLGYVPQSIYLCDESVARNIAFGVPPGQIDMAAVERAARLANLHDFIVSELPQGYDTLVGERGVRLSGGQRQRVGIARALYHDPEVLVLDEATSALDGVTEEGIFQAVENVAKSKTVIMIAHRLSTVRNCDVIFLLDRGRVIAQGSYGELLASSPQFRAMAQLEPREVVGNI